MLIDAEPALWINKDVWVFPGDIICGQLDGGSELSVVGAFSKLKKVKSAVPAPPTTEKKIAAPARVESSLEGTVWRIRPKMHGFVPRVQWIGATRQLQSEMGLKWVFDFPPESSFPLQMECYESRPLKGILGPYEFGQGGSSSEVVVGPAFRALVLEMDPDTGWFGPIRLKTHNDHIVENAHWLFKTKRRLYAIVPDPSDVTAEYKDPVTKRRTKDPSASNVFMRYAWTSGKRQVTFNREKLGTAFIFGTKHLGNSEVYVTGEFLAEMDARDLGPFDRQQMDVF